MAEEAELARQAAKGDPDAFTALVRLHEHAVRRFLTRLVPADAADDLAQEVFLKAWRMRSQRRDGGSCRAWLMRIAWTSFLEARRSDGRRLARDQTAYECFPLEGAPSGELALDVARALAGLNQRERAAAQLCLAEGYSHGEAATILDLPLGTLKSLVARAKTHLAAALGATA